MGRFAGGDRGWCSGGWTLLGKGRRDNYWEEGGVGAPARLSAAVEGLDADKGGGSDAGGKAVPIEQMELWDATGC